MAIAGMRTRATAAGNLIVFLHFALRVLAFPLLVVYFFSRVARDRRYFGTLAERLGFLPREMRRSAHEAIWLHAVSVGEVMSSVRLIEELKKRQPGIGIFVSTATLAGRELAEKRLQGLARGIFYAPVDYGFAVRRVLRRLRPSAVVILETEIWPVLFRAAVNAGCALVVVNGRISDRALPRYQRYRFFFRHVLSLPDRIFVQSEQDRDRYVDVGAPADAVQVLGNIKYDALETEANPAPDIAEFLRRVQPDRILIAASTMPGIDSEDLDEDRAVAAAFQELSGKHPRLLMILAPRRPPLFEAAARKLHAANIAFVRRSELNADSAVVLPGVLLLDTIGELAGLFPLADIVFMGGTLARRGGHNLLEPAASGRPIVCGPHMENFAAIAREFRAAGALESIEEHTMLSAAVSRLLADPARREVLGARARALADGKRGAAARAAAEIFGALDRALPLWKRHGISAIVPWFLSRLWILGTAIRRLRERPRSLDRPVVSIGGLAMGGVGKTPFCVFLAGRLAERGRHPAILTRGYRRRSLQETIILEAGATAETRMTGDEAQIFLRFARAHVGIGADRWKTGRRMAEVLDPGIFLLDDGFQHTRLKRDLDIVLIDAMDPLPGGGVFPAGRLREPVTALRRADCFVITRAQPKRRYEGIRDLLSRYNPGAPIFLARVEARSWFSQRTGEPGQVPEGPLVAFCGLGNPAIFWRTLDKLEILPVFQWTFGDHHVYLPSELARLARQAIEAGAAALLTTEKDAMNLPDNALEIVRPLEIYWLKIDVYVDREDDLLQLVESTEAAKTESGRSVQEME
jgi:tetraacyldisaccharide 4'-kinase